MPRNERYGFPVSHTPPGTGDGQRILNDVEKQAEAVNTGIHHGGKRGNRG